MKKQEKSNEKKYRIDEFLNNLNNETRLLAMKNLPSALSITRQTFSKWRTIRIDDKREIPSIKLIQLANFFNKEVNELINMDITGIDVPYLKRLDENTTAQDLGLVN